MIGINDNVPFSFDFGDGIGPAETELEHVYENDGTYSLKFTGQKEFCAFKSWRLEKL